MGPVRLRGSCRHPQDQGRPSGCLRQEGQGRGGARKGSPGSGPERGAAPGLGAQPGGGGPSRAGPLEPHPAPVRPRPSDGLLRHDGAGRAHALGRVPPRRPAPGAGAVRDPGVQVCRLLRGRILRARSRRSPGQDPVRGQLRSDRRGGVHRRAGGDVRRDGHPAGAVPRRGGAREPGALCGGGRRPWPRRTGACWCWKRSGA